MGRFGTTRKRALLDDIISPVANSFLVQGFNAIHLPTPETPSATHHPYWFSLNCQVIARGMVSDDGCPSVKTKH